MSNPPTPPLPPPECVNFFSEYIYEDTKAVRVARLTTMALLVL